MLNTRPPTYNTLYLYTSDQTIVKSRYIFCASPTADGNRQQTEKARFSRSLGRIRCKLAAESKSARTASLHQRNNHISKSAYEKEHHVPPLKNEGWSTLLRDRRCSTQDMNGDPAGGLQHASCCFQRGLHGYYVDDLQYIMYNNFVSSLRLWCDKTFRFKP